MAITAESLATKIKAEMEKNLGPPSDGASLEKFTKTLATAIVLEIKTQLETKSRTFGDTTVKFSPGDFL